MSDYNGWKNWETWLVNVWWGDFLNEYYLDLYREGQLSKKINPEVLKDNVESFIFDTGFLHSGESMGGTPENGFLTDLVTGAISAVDWSELAESIDELIKYEMEAQ